MQALENVAGVNQVSEGQAAVPAVRGLARGRTLILIDGARVSVGAPRRSERDVPRSRSSSRASTWRAVRDRSRTGRMRSAASSRCARARVAPASPLARAVQRHARRRHPGTPRRGRGVEGPRRRRRAVRRAHARGRRLRQPRRARSSTPATRDHGFLGRVEHASGTGCLSVGWQSDFGRDIERPRNNSRTVRFYYPTEDSHRFTAGYEPADVGGLPARRGSPAFSGTYDAASPIRIASPTATTGRSIERADISAKDFHVRGFGERLLGPARARGRRRRQRPLRSATRSTI